MRIPKNCFARFFSVLFLLPSSLLLGDQSKAGECHRKIPDTHADYVIVGVGTAGATLANRLTNDKKTSVIALHNGENLTKDPDIKFSENALTTILSALLGIPPFSLTGDTTEQPFADNEIFSWAMGLPLGGTSSVNAGAYCRGTNELYAHWEAIAGPKWSVNRILNTYKELEHYHGQTQDPSARGYHGPISVRQNPVPSGVSQVFTDAIISGAGVPFVLDYNDPNAPIGASLQMQYTQSGADGSLRVSSATAFLDKKVMTAEGVGVDGRKLRVHFNTTALRTLWKGKTAVGVEYLQDGEYKEVYAKKGVIVCAGLFSSPFLLHSGVGPKKVLKKNHIPLVFDNPNVGQDLADQPHVLLIYTSNPEDTPIDNHNSIFDQTSWLPDPAGDPNVRKFRLSTVTPIPGLTFALFDLVQPKSRGTVSINSNNPLDPPVVNPGLLTNSEDLDLYVRGFQSYIQNINANLPAGYSLLFPNPDIINNQDFLIEFIKAEIGPTQHWQSHCKMAPLDQGGVVNSNGRVHGVKNLYVADNSISPLDMDGSPMASAFMIAANIARILNEGSQED